ncbi:hypothetical protein E4U61_002212 [Claviceps capensis]|nr:hypothetical protein E4U61_002212 [Claviceps capensis]
MSIRCQERLRALSLMLYSVQQVPYSATARNTVTLFNLELRHARQSPCTVGSSFFAVSHDMHNDASMHIPLR